MFPPLFSEVRKVQETLRGYCLPADAIPLPKQNLRYAIEQEYGVKIEVITIPLGSDLLRGMIEIYEDLSVIYIDGELNSAWTRYVFAKEACHHLLNDEQFRTADPRDLIEYIVLDEQDIDGQPPAPGDVQAEMLTKFAAIELLFPYEMRAQCVADIAAGTATTYSLAEHFDIPEHLVQFALRDYYFERLLYGVCPISLG